jgi:ureidoglycolate lyase
MLEKPVQELSLEKFAKYGAYAQMLNPDAPKIGEEPIEFFRDMLQLELDTAHSVSISTCRVLRRDPIVDISEFHTSCGEGMVALDADVCMHFGPATAEEAPPLDDIEIFLVPRGTALVIRPGVWHHAPFAADTDCANVLILLPERTYANDCHVMELDEDDQIRFRG